MSEFLVDAPLLACPDPANYSKNEFQDVFHGYLSRLTELTRLRASCKSIRFWQDEKLQLVLNDENCFPFRHSLEKAFDALFDPAEFQLQDVNVLANAFIQKSLVIENAGEIRDLVVKDCSLSGDPVDDRSAPFLEHICRVVALALPVLGTGQQFHPNTYIASRGRGNASEIAEATYTVEMVEKSDGSYLGASPATTVQIANFRGADPLFKEANLVAWWRKASKEGILDACAIRACCEEAEPWEAFSIAPNSLDIGKDFISSAHRLGFMHDESKIGRLLRACADLILGRNLNQSHALRVGKGPNDAQRTRGTWSAWRHDVDYEFHLHYWRSGTDLELANVVTHNEFDISS